MKKRSSFKGFRRSFALLMVAIVTVAQLGLPAGVVDISGWNLFGSSEVKAAELGSNDTAINDFKYTYSLNDDGTVTCTGVDVETKNKVEASATTNLVCQIADKDGKVTIGGKNYTVTAIEKSAFAGMKFRILVLPDTVTSIGNDAFSKSSLSVIYFQSTSSKLATIGDRAFSGTLLGTDPTSSSTTTDYKYGDSEYYSLNLPASVTSIGEEAFKDNTVLKSVKISSKSCAIGDSAFEGCTSIDHVSLAVETDSSSADSLGSNIFKGCTKLKSLKLSSKLYSIPSGFAESTGIKFSKDFTEDNVAVSLADATFASADATKDYGSYIISFSTTPKDSDYGDSDIFTLPDTITTIGDTAFKGIAATKLVMPSSLTTLGSESFSGCSSATSITLNENLETIGDKAFSGTSRVQVIGDSATIESASSSINGVLQIPQNVKTIGEAAFYNSGSSKSSDVNGMISITFEDGTNIESIGTQCFSSIITAKSVTIPSNITAIPDQCFSGCTSLETVLIYTTVTSIGEKAFYNCKALNKLWIYNLSGKMAYDSSELSSIGASAFANCSGLESFTIPSKVNKIPSSMFSGCTSLVDLTMSGEISEIGSSAFSGCVALPSFDLSAINKTNGLTSIGSNAFAGCSKLSTFKFSDNDTITSIPSGCFGTATDTSNSKVTYSCTSLTSLTIPTTVKSIGSSAFSGATALTTVNGTDNVTSIGSSAFSGCTKFTGFEGLDSLVTSASISESSFAGCTSLTVANLSGTMTSISKNAFSGCTKLATVYVPSKVTKLESGAFANCPITSITINLRTGTAFTIADAATVSGMKTNGFTLACDSAMEDYITAAFAKFSLVPSSVEHLAPRDITKVTPSTETTKNISGIGTKYALTIVRGNSSGYTAVDEDGLDSSEPLTWTSQDETIATVDRIDGNGNVITDATKKESKITITPLSYGSTKVIGKTTDGTLQITYVVCVAPASSLTYDNSETVIKNPIKSITIKNAAGDLIYSNDDFTSSNNKTADTSIELYKGEANQTLTATVEYANGSATGTNDKLFWYVAGGKSEIVGDTLTSVDVKSGTTTYKYYISTGNISLKASDTNADNTSAYADNLKLVTNSGIGITIKLNNYTPIASMDANYSTVSPLAVSVGESVALTKYATISPSKYTDKITFTSTNDAIASVNESGSISALAPGSATVTATVERTGKSIQIPVEVCSAAGSGMINNNVEVKAMYKNQTRTLALSSATSTPIGATEVITWVSSNEDLVTITPNGLTAKVKCVSASKGTVTIKAQNGLGKDLASVKIEILESSTKVSVSSLSLVKGVKNLVIKPTVVGASKTVKYKSSKAKVVAITAKGKVTAKKPGKATITVTANGISAKIAVTVVKGKAKLAPTISGATAKKTTYTISKSNKTTSVNVGANWTTVNVTYKSSNKKVAKIDKTGNITLKKKGTAKITVTADGMKKVVTLKVTK